MYDVIFYEAFQEEQQALKAFMPKKIKALYVKDTIQESAHKKLKALVISLRTQSQIPLEWAADLKGILTRSTGHDHLRRYLLDTKSDIPCGYLPNYCSRAVAEHALLVLLNLMHKIPQQRSQFSSFHRDNITGSEGEKKKLLIIGVGRIGTQIARVAKGWGMDVKGVDIDPKYRGIKYVSLKTGVKWAEAIISAAPLTEKTQGMLNYELLKSITKAPYLVNISRGEITPTLDMKKCIDKKVIAGLGMDVFEQEGALAEDLRGKKKRGNANFQAIKYLMKKNNVIFTPHNAFNTKEAVIRKSEQSAQSIKSFFKKKNFIDPVPVP